MKLLRHYDDCRWELAELNITSDRTLRRYQAAAYYGLVEEWDFASNGNSYHLVFTSPFYQIELDIADLELYRSRMTVHLLLHSIGRRLI